MRREEILSKIGDNFGELRKSDGTKYKGDHNKALNGALYSTGIFHHDNDHWTIRQNEIESYERKMRLKLESKGKRKRTSNEKWRNWFLVDGGVDEGYAKRKYTRRHIKRGAIVKMLKDTSERLRMNNKETNSVYFKNPFQVPFSLLIII